MKKYLGIVLALVLVLTLGLVTAVPVGAAVSPQFLDVVPVNVITGEWVTEVEQTGPAAGTHSYHLVLPEDASEAGLDIFYTVGPMTLADLSTMTFFEYVKVVGGTDELGAGITLYLDKNLDGVFDMDVDVQIVLESPKNSDQVLDHLGEWALRDIADFRGFDKGGGQLNLRTETGGTLAEWLTEEYATWPLLRVGIVVGWGFYGNYDGYFDDFTINGVLCELEPSSTVGLTAELETITAISVTPTSIDFGTLHAGESSSAETITVENIGTVMADVETNVTLTGTVFDYLTVSGLPLPTIGLIDNLGLGETVGVDAQLVVPDWYSAKGIEKNQLVFVASTP